jgi:hypothetical protein
MDTDGYIVSVCRPEEGRYKAIARTTGSHLLVNSFKSSGLHYFRVAAYVEVGETRVFNTGLIGQMEIDSDMISPAQPENEPEEPSSETGAESTTLKKDADKKVAEESAELSAPEQPVEIPDAAEMGEPVSYVESVQKIAAAHPGLNGVASVYNPFYPEITNPFFETVKEDGTVIPPLLTNDAIDRTVVRLQKKREEQGLVTVDFTAVAAAPRPSNQQTVSGIIPPQSTAQPTKTAVAESPVPKEVKIQPAKTDAVQKPVTDLLKNVETAKQNLATAKPEQAPPSSPTPSLPAEPESSGFGLILTIAIILGVVYFVVAKEAK